MEELVRFWAPLTRGGFVHPQDKATLEKLQCPGLRTEDVPVPWTGPILKADVFLLYLNPGTSKRDPASWAQDLRRYDHLVRSNLTGTDPNYMFEHGYRDIDEGAEWLLKRLRGVADETTIRNKIAVLELVAYRSPSFKFWHLPSALASSRIMLDTLHRVLLPMAERGEILIVCARAATQWGLTQIHSIPNLIVANGSNRSGLLTLSTDAGKRIKRFLQEPQIVTE